MSTTPKTYVYVGPQADVLANGRPIEDGERVSRDELDLEAAAGDQRLIDAGHLLPAPRTPRKRT